MSRRAADGGERTEQLGREDLIRLVAELRSTVARHEETIARQAAAIATLRARGAQSSEQPLSSGSNGVSGSASEQGRRALAERVPGFDYTIVFDGGAIGNPGFGYGSYQIVGPQGIVVEERLEFGDEVTNNQAEYRTLIRALEALCDRIGQEASQASVAIRGDSQLVVQTVTGRWKVREPTLRLLFHQAVELLDGFRRTHVAWHGRDASVRVLGH